MIVRISQSWNARDTQIRSNWEQIAVILLAGVQVALDIFFWRPNVAYCSHQDHVEAHSNGREFFRHLVYSS